MNRKRDRLKAIIIDANGFGWKATVSDTIFKGIFNLPFIDFPDYFQKWFVTRKISNAFKNRYANLSYVLDWKEAFLRSDILESKVINISDLLTFARNRKNILSADLIIVLHSAAGDDMTNLNLAYRWFAERKGKLVVFLGNEYDLMDEKIAFLKSSRADYVCSQLPLDSANWLYGDSGAKIVTMPHALNPGLYKPAEGSLRHIDIGFRGAFYPLFIGDCERNLLLESLQRVDFGNNLVTDINKENIPRSEWSLFLNCCKGIPGAEAGTYFLDKKGEILKKAKDYTQRNPEATFQEVFDCFFKEPALPYVSGKAISSRHFEAIGTKTCQLLIEGSYNGILVPDQHYISIKKNLSNLDQAIAKLRDESFRSRIVNQTYEYVMDCHTYDHRITKLLSIVLGK